MASLGVGYFGDARLEKGAQPLLMLLQNVKRCACVGWETAALAKLSSGDF
jgi:hypothetical protein